MSEKLNLKTPVTYYGGKQNNPDMFSELKRAWALWVLSSQGFAGQIDSSWGYDVGKRTTTKKIMNKKESFTQVLAIKLQDVQLECADALYIIKSRDRDTSFFYVDPPYYNSDMGHYDGYSLNDFTELLDLLSLIKGKFLLSSYPSEVLKEYTKNFKWHTQTKKSKVSVAAKGGNQKDKIEVLTANYAL